MLFKEKTKAVIFVSLICVAFFVGGIYVGYTDRPNIDRIVGVDNKDQTSGRADFEPFWKTWLVLNEKAIAAGEITDQQKIWGAIKGLTSSYGDEYTEFFDPEETAQFDEAISGEFSGVGLEVGMKDGVLTVIAPIKGTPASETEIKSGDAILKIDGQSTAGMSVDQAVQKIRGTAGTPVILTIFHAGDADTKDIKIIRKLIVVPSIDTSTEGDYFVMTMYTFTGSNINADIEKAMRQFKSSGKKRLIIDLRGNPGGYLDSAIYMSSFFLPAGAIVVTEDFGDKKPSVSHRSQGIQLIDKSAEVAILIDGGSASASEIVAGALRDHGRAILVGEKSFGKGSVQEIVPITDETILKVTVAKWLTPKGVSIQDDGITPDHEALLPDDWEIGDNDNVLGKAKDLLR